MSPRAGATTRGDLGGPSGPPQFWRAPPMPHFPKPFYRAPRNTWYVQLGKDQHPLGKHPDPVPPPVKRNGEWHPVPREIWTAYQDALAARDVPGPAAPDASAP